MKLVKAAVLLLPTIVTIGYASAACANADDVEWINQRIADNQD